MRREPDRRTLAEDLILLAEHLRGTYNLSVTAIHLPVSRPRLLRDISHLNGAFIEVVLSAPIPPNLEHAPPGYLDYYPIEYIEP